MGFIETVNENPIDIELMKRMLDHLDLQFPTFDWRRAYGNLSLYFSRMRDRASIREVLGEY